MARIKGTSNNDHLVGTAGNDILIGGGGNDSLSGGSGHDTAKYLGNMSQYRFSNVNGKLVVTSSGAEGKDTLTNIETLQLGNDEITVSNIAFQVNSDALAIRTNPNITTLNDGGFVVAWIGYDEGVYAQRFSAEGVALGEEFHVNTTSITSFFDGANIADLSNGGFVISWNKGADIYAQIYNVQGQSQGGEFQLGALHSEAQVNSHIATLTNGDFVVVWQNGIPSDGVFAQRFNAAGMEQGGIFKVNDNATSDGYDPSVATLADGGFVVSWTYFGSDSEVFAQRYNAAGVAQGAEFQVNTYTISHQSNSSITALANGGFVVSWESSGQDGDGNGIYAQRFNAAGVAQGAEFRVNTTIGGDQHNSSITALADGGFVVVWVSGRGSLYAQRYDSQAIVQGAELEISNIGENILGSYDHQFSVTALADGGFVVSWASQIQEVDFIGHLDSSIYAQRYDANGNAVGTIKLTGTANADLINLNAGNSGLVVDGAGGNDTITGAGANDTLLGGAGNDVLKGNAGDDYLDGGADADKMFGGTGNDTYVVNHIQDKVIELANAGIDKVISSITHTLAKNVENLTLTGTANINGTGNAQGNAIIGNIGNNLLNGKAGADVLDGGAGNDTLIGGAGNDLLTGGAGNDTFRFNTKLNALNNVDEILDFNVSDDTIQLSKTIFTTVGAGNATGITLNAAAFNAGDFSVAQDASDRIIYNSTTGDLYYDKDGTAAAIKFAHLDAGLGLTHADFSVIL